MDDSSSTPARKRNRASAACTACRRSRIRCIVEPSQRSCKHCLTTGSNCFFDEKDGRKSRTSSKAYASVLAKRIEQLESMLKQQPHGGAASSSPPPTDPPGNPLPILATSEHHGESGSDGEEHHAHVVVEDDPPVVDIATPLPEDAHLVPPPSPPPHDEPPPYQDLSGSTQPPPESHFPMENNMRKLIPCPVRFDMASGRVRFFGPTKNMHFSSATVGNHAMAKRPVAHWPIATLIRDLTMETHDYLMELYWTCHNSHIHLVHKDAFYDDLQRGNTQFYSILLHFTLLAIGFRYADKSKPGVQKLALTEEGSSTLHIKAKKLAQLELEQTGGIPSIQALFLLGDLECASGRDDTGWMFAGMAFRLVFDVGLHVDASELQITERELQIRHMVLWACIINDRYWSLYVGRPTSLKPTDMAPSCLTKDFGRLLSCRPSGHEKSPETKVYEALLQLMDLVEPLSDTVELKKTNKATDAYFKIAALDRELNDWYNTLPEYLTWNTHNINTAPASFFLLHSQYHAALILLHRPFVNYEHPEEAFGSSEDANRTNHFSVMSRAVCKENAILVCSILEAYRNRFNMAQLFVIGLQHAGTAATALMGEIIINQFPDGRQSLLQHLTCLGRSLNLLSKTYHPAALMSSVVNHFITDLDGRGASGQTISDDDPEASLQRHRSSSSNMNSDSSSSSTSSSSSSWAAGQHHHTGSQSQRAIRADGFPTYDTSTGMKRPSHSMQYDSDRTPYMSSKRYRRDEYQPQSSHSYLLHPSNGHGHDFRGVPFLPSQWPEEMDWEDTEFLNLMGLKDLQNSVPVGLLNEFGLAPGSL